MTISSPKKLRVSELFFFFSLQGEGLYTGVPSVFLRMFGCNFRCKNFGRYQQDILSETQPNPDVMQVIKTIDQYTTFNDLPIVSTGCDSYSSVYPEFKRYTTDHTPESLANAIVDLLPFKEWRDEHLVITGGEPLLGWQKAYMELLSEPKMRDLKAITFETNGTQKLTSDFQHYMGEWIADNWDREITFSVSPKLPCSGEKWEDAIRPEIVASYQDMDRTYLKFVVATEDDVQCAIKAIKEYRSAGFSGSVYLMPLGGTTETFFLNNKTVAELALKYGLRYSDRLHVGLWKNRWGT